MKVRGEELVQLRQAGYLGAVVDVFVPTIPVQENRMDPNGPGSLDVGLVLVAYVEGLAGGYMSPVQGRLEDGRMGLLGAGLLGGDAEVQVWVQPQPGA